MEVFICRVIAGMAGVIRLTLEVPERFAAAVFLVLSVLTLGIVTWRCLRDLDAESNRVLPRFDLDEGHDEE